MNPRGPHVRVFADAAAVAVAVAHDIAAAAVEACESRGAFRLGVPGGRSPVAALRALWRDTLVAPDLWARTTVLFADERAVAPTSVDSNFRMVREALLDPLGDLAPRCERMRGEAPDLEEAALDYGARLATPLDVLVLGIGEDGHVASLFPGSAALGESTRRVVVVRDSPKPPAARLTITPPVIARARQVLVLATGHAKAAAVSAALAPHGTTLATPARLALHGTWMLDRDAAGAR